jgi:hypothetical protein
MELTEPGWRLFRWTAKRCVAGIGAKASELSTAADVGLYASAMLGPRVWAAGLHAYPQAVIRTCGEYGAKFGNQPHIRRIGPIWQRSVKPSAQL